jgi:uncharacterized membrane protein YpjA
MTKLVELAVLAVIGLVTALILVPDSRTASTFYAAAAVALVLAVVATVIAGMRTPRRR